MPHLDIEPKEAEVLKEVLEFYLSDLRMEIADTDRLEFRNELKDQKALLERISKRLNTVFID
jgi:hypothetical protein